MSRFEDFFHRLQGLTPIKNQADLARELGVGRAAISIAKQKDVIPSKWLFELSEKFGVNPTYLLEGKGPSFVGEGDTSIVVKRFLGVEEGVKWGTLHLHEAGFKQGSSEIWFMEVKTRAMEPLICRGDIAIIEPGRCLEYGEIHLLRYGHRICLRRIEPHGEKLLLMADNDTYPPLETREEDIEAIGIVRYVFKRL